MPARAYLTSVRWPYAQLSRIGKLSAFFLGSGAHHVGVLFVDCTPAEVAAHSTPGVSEEGARHEATVSFDYQLDQLPRFQSPRNPHYFTAQTRVRLHELRVDPAALHAACVRLATLRPRNRHLYRLAALGPTWLPSFCRLGGGLVAPSTCVALCLRAIATALDGNEDNFESDARTLAALGAPRGACAPRHLNALKPERAIELLRAEGLLGAEAPGFAVVLRT